MCGLAGDKKSIRMSFGLGDKTRSHPIPRIAELPSVVLSIN